MEHVNQYVFFIALISFSIAMCTIFFSDMKWSSDKEKMK